MTHYNVSPRYSPGSPALVSREIALKVARDEKEFIQHALEGAWGEEQKKRAERLGLRGIVEARDERRSGKNSGWEVEDLCTGERFFRLAPEGIQKLGYKRYDEFDSWEKSAIDMSKPIAENYREHGWFKLKPCGLSEETPYGMRVEMYEPKKEEG